jgi:hypothetical protein
MKTMGLFDKNETCSICGANKSFLGVTTLQDGKICSDCAKKFSNQFKANKKTSLAVVQTHLQYREQNEIAFSKFSNTDKIANFIVVDKNLKKLYFPSITTNGKIPDLFDFSQIADYELLEDGETITSKKVSLGKAAIGTVLLGPVGTIIGGVSGKSKTKSTCTTMSIRISINSELLHQIELPLLAKKEVKTNSSAYKTAKNNANSIISLLDVVSQIAENDKTISVEIKNNDTTNSIADELKKMQGLLSDGIISQQEFDTFKNNLLGI